MNKYMWEGYFLGYPLLVVLGAWMTFKKAIMAKTLRNGLIMIETNPLNLNGWILRFSWGWHCTSLKKTAVMNAKKCMWHYKNQALYHNKNHIVISLDTIQAIYFCTFRLQKSIIH